MRRRYPSAQLSLSRLDDRITPASGSTNFLSLPYPEYWHESKFLPTQSTPAADGGTWVIGTTHTAGRFAWWGNWNQDWAIVKLTAAGTIDPAFNGGKVKNLDSGLLEWYSFQDLQAGPDGTLYALARNTAYDPRVASGQSATAIPVPLPTDGPDEDFAVVRFHADGSFDETFDGDGMALFDLDLSTDPTQWNNGGQAVFAIGPNGSVTVAAVRNEYLPDPNDITADVVRLTPDGEFDGTFDGDGRATLDVVPNADSTGSPLGRLVGIAVGVDGSVTFGGAWTEYQITAFVSQNATGLFAARLTSGGTADVAFDGDGVSVYQDTIVGPNSDIYVNDFAVGGDGLYFGGTKVPQWDEHIAVYPFYPAPNEAIVIRLTGTGSLDASFDGDGVAYPDFGDGRNVTSGDQIAPLPGGGVAFAGQDMLPPPNPGDPYPLPVYSIVIGKLTGDGTVDAGFIPIHPPALGYGTAADLDALADGGLAAVVGYPTRLIETDADGGEFTEVTVPYDRRGPWQPPPDFVPFPWQPICRTDTGDLNGDGVDDYVYVTGVGSSSGVRVVDGQTGFDLVTNVMPYEEGFRGGMFVVVADFDGDGHDDLVVSPDEGGSARVQVFTFEGGALVQQANYFAIEDPNFRGGGSIAVSDVNGDGTPDLLVGAAKGGSQRIATFDGKTLFGRHSLPPVLHGDYFAPLPGVDPATYRGGVSLRTQDVNGDGHDDVVMFAAGAEADGVVLFHGTSDGRAFRYRTLATASFGLNPSSGLFEYDIAGNVSRNVG